MNPHRSLQHIQRLAIAGLTVFMTACGSSEEQVPESQAERVIEQLALTMEWRRGGMDDDTVLFNPWELRARDDQVVALDRDGYRIQAFSADDGAFLWSFGRRGDGPMEFDEPTSLFRTQDGWGVWDPGLGRLTLVDREGAFDGERFLASDRRPEQLCTTAGGSIVALFGSGETAAGAFGLDGSLVSTAELPTRELRDLQPIQRQADWASTSDGQCIAYLKLGGGFAELEVGGFAQWHDYVEAVAPPQASTRSSGNVTSTRIELPVIAVHDALVHGPELWLLFGGESDNAGRIIDVHEASSGAYIQTLELPVDGAESMARFEDRLFLTRTLDGYPVLEAYRINSERDSAGSQTR